MRRGDVLKINQIEDKIYNKLEIIMKNYNRPKGQEITLAEQGFIEKFTETVVNGTIIETVFIRGQLANRELFYPDGRSWEVAFFAESNNGQLLKFCENHKFAGERHFVGGPASTIYYPKLGPDGRQLFREKIYAVFNRGVHREDGPAVIWGKDQLLPNGEQELWGGKYFYNSWLYRLGDLPPIVDFLPELDANGCQLQREHRPSENSRHPIPKPTSRHQTPRSTKF